jgi:hypothetical protein
MGKKWIAVNFLLLGMAALLAWQLQLSVDRFKGENDLGKLPPVPQTGKGAQQDVGLAPPQALRRYNPGEFGVIPGQNLFSDVRGKPDEEPKPAVQEAPTLTVKPVLVGVTLAGSQRFASIIDPSTPAQGRRTQTRRVGDVYQGYTIVDIAENQMVLQYGTRQEIIPLFDSTKQKGGSARTAIAASRVVAFGAAAAGAAGPAVSPTAVTNRAQQAAGPTAPSAGASAAVGQPAGGTGQPSVRTTIPPPQGQARQVPGNAPQQQPLAPNERIDEQGRRIIRTPFGDIVREKPNN